MRLRASITLFLGLSVLAGTSWAQAIGSITGVVQDATQARVPGVTVTATNTATGVKTQLITNESGAYNFPILRSGRMSSEHRCQVFGMLGLPTSTCGSTKSCAMT
jgi:hypothetical protein